ncbi:MAG: TPM domain-containing protein [Bacteroidia bacterium]|nr:TPM domain-containing protein [Bacteroidia bacterium]
MKKANFFTEEELGKIETAVKQSESKTSGEIVPVFVNQCATYPAAIYKGGVTLALIVFVALILMDRMARGFLFYDPFWYLIVVSGAGVVGALGVKYIPALHRWLAGKNHLREMAYFKANEFFLQEEVFHTADRTGIMIFIAWFEHQVIIMADKGISQVVEQSSWDHIVEEMVTFIKSGKVSEGIIKAVEDCSKLLAEKGVDIKPDDKDELSNQLRTE